MSRQLLVAVLLVACGLTIACVPFSSSYEKALQEGKEGATIATLQSIATEQASYSLSNHGAFGSFQQLVKARLLDDRFNSEKPKVYGYVFTMTVVPKSADTQRGSYRINADPDGSRPPGRHFYVDVAGNIHVNASQPANASDPLFTDQLAK